MSNFRSPSLLRLARDESCVNCGAEDGTVVAAHSNMPEHGKGQSLKSHDCFAAHLCVRCHQWLDAGKGMDPTGRYQGNHDEKREMFIAAMDATTLRLWTSGKVRVKA